jgi:2-hydroxychromene-2-carboxylate isomerase
MKARMPSELAQSRTKVVTIGGMVSKILKLLAVLVPSPTILRDRGTLHRLRVLRRALR